MDKLFWDSNNFPDWIYSSRICWGGGGGSRKERFWGWEGVSKFSGFLLEWEVSHWQA